MRQIRAQLATSMRASRSMVPLASRGRFHVHAHDCPVIPFIPEDRLAGKMTLARWLRGIPVQACDKRLNWREG